MNPILLNDLVVGPELQDIIDNPDTPEEEKQFAVECVVSQQMAVKGKVNAMIWYIQSVDKRAELIQERIQALSLEKKRIAAGNESIKISIKKYMEIKQIEEIETGDYKIKLAKCPPSVEIDDETLIPTEYRKTVITESIDKNALKERLKTGEDIPGAFLVTDKKRLNIK